MACHAVSPLLKDNHSITKWHKVVAGEGDDLANLDYITAIDDDFNYTVNVRGNWYDVLQAEERRREISKSKNDLQTPCFDATFPDATFRCVY